MPYVEAKNARLWYETYGPEDGYPLVFIHGGGGNTLVWFQQACYFSQFYRVILLDIRCFKNSECRPEDFHCRDLPDDLVRVLDAEGITNCALVCQSLGAWAGLPVAVRHPKRIDALVINGAPTPIDAPEIYRIWRRAADSFHTFFKDPTGRKLSDLGIPDDFAIRRPDLVLLYRMAGALNRRVNVDSMMADDVRIPPSELSGYEVPTLVCGGHLDEFLTGDCHLVVQSYIPNADAYTFMNCGHSAYFEEADHFNGVVHDFLSRVGK